jgi:hypothetical protein
MPARGILHHRMQWNPLPQMQMSDCELEVALKVLQREMQ